jgi:tripartite-type tricarboxylate transporter receptor subunit TctC
MKTSRRALLALFPALIACPASAFPERSVTLVVPAPPGGALDFGARLLAGPLGQELGTSVVVENRSGGNGSLATQAVRGRVDGHTLLFGYSGFVSALPALTDTPALDATLEPVGLVMEAPHLIVVPQDGPADLGGLLAAARARPGGLNYGSSGIGSVPHLATELICARAGIRMEHVAYRGSGPLVQDLLAGRVQVTVISPVSVLGHIQAGRLRAIAVASPRRLEILPAVPTAAEGGLPSLDVDAWYGVYAAAGVPGPVKARLAAALERSVANEGFARAVRGQGAVPRWQEGPALASRAAEELRMWTALARANNIRAE